jgi:hypothetical protein
MTGIRIISGEVEESCYFACSVYALEILLYILEVCTFICIFEITQ